jgi:prophage regulatory protein
MRTQLKGPVGAHEIRIRLGEISRQRAYQLTRSPQFPAPIVTLAQGAIWSGDAVEEWMTTHRRIRG